MSTIAEVIRAVAGTADAATPVIPAPEHTKGAAGILFIANDGSVLTLRRGNGGDFPGHWAIPGGHLENDETAEQAARREVEEETGFKYKGPVRELGTFGGFTCFVADWHDAPFAPTLCDESTGYAWTLPVDIPAPAHPGMDAIFRVLSADTELAVAELIRDGVLGSPQRYGNVSLFALRVTGTGTAFRSKSNEHVFRPPEHYLNDEFLRRCLGLPVLWKHPPKKPTLDSKEFSERIIGTICLSYIKGDEVWGIAKIYDDQAVADMTATQLSTSPGVVLAGNGADVKITLDDKQTLLIEGKPFLLDHLAVEPRGVWDKGGAPSGVELTNEEMTMADAARNDSAPALTLADLQTVVAPLAESIKGLTGRLDSMEESERTAMADKAKKDADEKAEMEAKAKKDAEEKEEMEAKAKKDADDEKAAADEKAKKDAAEADERAKMDADAPKFADCQARADSVYAAFGDSAPRQLAGESLGSYRVRLLGQVKKHSPQFRDVDLNQFAVNDAVLAVVEKQIYADAAGAAIHPTDVAPGTLREVRKADATGRMITTFYGEPGVAFAPFKAVGRRIAKINKGDRAAA